MAHGIPIHHYARQDLVAEAYAVVTLMEDGLATVTELHRALGHARFTCYRWERAYAAGGVMALAGGKSGPKGPSVLGGAAARRLVALRKLGVPNTRIAHQLGVTEAGVRHAAKRMGLTATPPRQPELLNEDVGKPGGEEATKREEDLGDRSEGQLGEGQATEVAAEIVSLDGVGADEEETGWVEVDLSDEETQRGAAEELALDVVVDDDKRASVDLAGLGSEPARIEAVPTPSDVARTSPWKEESTVPSSTPIVAPEERPEAPRPEEVRLVVSADVDPRSRNVDRLMARLGLLEDAVPLFGNCDSLPGVGVLLAVPALVQSGVITSAQEVYGSLGAAFYGIRNVLMSLLFMALLRVKTPESLRHGSPTKLGWLLGLDRAPEARTLRCKVKKLGRRKKSEEFMRVLTRRRVKAQSEAMGFLYVDGHVRVYSGKHKISKAHATRLRLSVPATVDHWVNDERGDPVFVVTATPTASLAKELPAILAEMRQQLGDRRVTVAFDRGGWSPKLFQWMLANGFDVLTYRKGKFSAVPRRLFQEHNAVLDGRKVKYQLAERKAHLLGGKLTLREVVRLTDTGHQTSVVTSREDLATVVVAYRMFERWRQENFLKYMGEEYALNALVTYGVEPVAPDQMVVNPARRRTDKEVREAKTVVSDLERQYGAAAADNEEGQRPTMRGFKIANKDIGKALRDAREHVRLLKERRRRLPAHIPAKKAGKGQPVVRLCPEEKRIVDALKMVAFQAETDLFRMLGPHYARNQDEGRKVIAAAFRSSGTLQVRDDELVVTLEPAASPNQTRALAHLCEELTASETRFPGSSLRISYAIQNP